MESDDERIVSLYPPFWYQIRSVNYFVQDKFNLKSLYIECLQDNVSLRRFLSTRKSSSA